MPEPTQDVSGQVGSQPDGVATRFGLPTEVFTRAWRIQDIANYLGLEKSATYRLMRDHGAPPRLRTGSNAYRWDGEQVMAWVRHLDWTVVHSPTIFPAVPDAKVDNQSQVHAKATTRQDSAAPVTVRVERSSEASSTGRGPVSAPNVAKHGNVGTTGVHLVDPAEVKRRTGETRMSALLSQSTDAKRGDGSPTDQRAAGGDVR